MLDWNGQLLNGRFATWDSLMVLFTTLYQFLMNIPKCVPSKGQMFWNWKCRIGKRKWFWIEIKFKLRSRFKWLNINKYKKKSFDERNRFTFLKEFLIVSTLSCRRNDRLLLPRSQMAALFINRPHSAWSITTMEFYN